MFSCRNFEFRLDNKKDLDYVYLIINYSNNFFNFGANIHTIETC